MNRRDELAEAATDWALEHGLIGLSLRPLAADLGTSDRMLLYHFADKDELVSVVLRRATQRAAAGLAALPPSRSPGAAVRDLWTALTGAGQLAYVRVYVEASALGVLGREPYRSVVLESNQAWWDALAGHFRAAGMTESAAVDASVLVDPALLGLLLDQALDGPRCERALTLLTRAVEDLAHGPTVTSIEG